MRDYDTFDPLADPDVIQWNKNQAGAAGKPNGDGRPKPQREDKGEEEERPSLPAFSAITTDTWDEQPPPQAQKNVRGLYERGTPHLVAAQGGVGKTNAQLELGVKLSMQEDRTLWWMGREVLASGPVVMLLSEDTKAQIHRRLWNMFPRGEWRNPRLVILPLIDMGMAHIPLLAKSNGTLTPTWLWEQLVERVLEFQPIHIFLDPAQKIAALDLDKDNTDAQYLATNCGELAVAANASVVVSHHMRKGVVEATTPEEIRESIRGASALVDGVRLSHAMWSKKTRDAEAIIDQLALDCYPTDIVREGVVKKNIEGVDMRVRTFLRERSGAFSDITERADKGVQTRSDALPELEVYRATCEFLRKAEEAGEYFTKNKLEESAGEDSRLQCGKRRLRGFLDGWVQDKKLRLMNHPTKRGIQVLKAPEAQRSESAF